MVRRPLLWFLPLAGLLVSAAALAGDGDLDPAFGPNGDGRVTVGVDSGAGDVAARVVPALDGGLFVIGSAAPGIGIVRLSADGVPDAEFAPVTYPADGDTLYVYAHAAALAGEGDLIVAGYYQQTQPLAGPFWLACRFNPDGTPDPAFGNGEIAPGCTDRFGTGVALRGSINDLVIQPNGRIVVAGMLFDGNDRLRAAMSRLTAPGDVDLSFGSAMPGQENLVVPMGNVVPESRYLAVSLGVFGELLAAGEYMPSPGESEMLVTRHGANGAPAVGFGSNGVAIVGIDLGSNGARSDVASAVALGEGGRIVIAGTAQHNTGEAAVVAWLDASGSLDTAMGSNGIRKLQMSGTNARFDALVRGPRGRMLAGGSLSSDGVNPQAALLVALDGEGDFDPTFGGQGIVGFEFVDTQDLDVPNVSGIADLAVQGDRVLAAGISVASGAQDFAVARIGDGRLFADGLESGGP